MKIIRHCNRAARYALLSGLVATALALSVVRFWLLPRAVHYRELLQTQIGALIGETVHIDGLAARMSGFNPHLVLKGFEIMDAEGVRPPLRLREVRITFSLMRSLMAGSPIMEGIRLEGGLVTLQRNGDGSWRVLGLQATDRFPAWLLADGEVAFRDIELSFRDLQASGETLVLGRADVLLRNEEGRHQLDAGLVLAGELGQSVRVSANTEGDLRSVDNGWARFYVEGRLLHPGLLGHALPALTQLTSGTADFKLWGQWQEGAFRQFTGRFDLTKPRTVSGTAGNGERQLTVNQMGGWFRWRTEKGGWQLDVKDFTLALDQHPWPETFFSIAVKRDTEGGPPSVRAAVSYVRLGDLQVWLDVLPVFGEIAPGVLSQLSPQGEIRNLALFYEPEASLGQRWAICGELIGASLGEWRDLPGFNHFNGKVCGTDQHGQVQFSMPDTELSMAKWFERPIRLDALDGRLDWWQTETEWGITSSKVELRAGGLEGVGRFQLASDKSSETSPFLDLRVHLLNADAASLRNYLPLVAMPKRSADWLGNAFVRGKVKEARVLFHGSLADFPFVDNEGVFEALADVEDLDLNYDPQWPPVQDADGSVQFHNAAMLIRAYSGALGEGKIKTAVAETFDLMHDPWLTVTGEVEASVPASMKFLRQTPLGYIPERLLKVADAQGDGIIALNLRIPLSKAAGELEVDGHAQLKDASLALSAANLDVRRINGSLHFSRDSLDARNVQAIFLGQPASIDVAQQGDEIFIEVSGRTPLSTLQTPFPAKFWKYTQGVLDYRLSLNIPDTIDATGNPLRMSLASDLFGLGINLPPPLGKTEKSRKDIRVGWTMQAGSKTRMRLVYGDEVRGQFLLSEPSAPPALVGGDLAVGRALPSVSKEAGLGFYINLAALDLGAWRQLFEENSGSAGYAFPLVRAFDVDVGRLNWNDADLGRLALSGRRTQRQWSGQIDSFFGKGQFNAFIPEFGWPSVKFDLDVIRVPKLSGDRPGFGAATTLDPAVMPALQISGRQLFWQDVDLGSVELETEHWTQGINIKKLTVRKANHQLTVKGGWMREGDRGETRIEGRFMAKDMGKFLAEMGRPDEIRETPAEVDFKLEWPGAPYQFSAGNVAGDIQVKLGRGSVLKMEPGVGRVLGMLNLYTLRRLLLLDFSDLFGKGLAYDSMEGRFQLANGQARTQSFVVDAVAAKIMISGRIGLVARDFDETVAVFPHTLATLPVAGALVGGAAVGAAISVARKLIGDESANIASTNYSVKGSWDDPQITRIGGYMPLEMLDRAWTGLKDLSGFGSKVEESQHE